MEPAMGTNSTDAAANRAKDEETKRNLASISPFFIVKDLQVSISHYIERLGFQLDFQGPDDGPYYAGVSRDGIGIMLKAILPDVLPQPNHTRHEWARWDAYIYTLGPDALFDEFSQRGASFVKKLSFIDEGLWGFEGHRCRRVCPCLLSTPPQRGAPAERRRLTFKTRKSMDGKHGGNAAKLADALVKLVALEEPPNRFAAGADAVQTFEAKAKTLLAQAQAHRELSTSLAYEDT
jgi:hypothetical protein